MIIAQGVTADCKWVVFFALVRHTKARGLWTKGLERVWKRRVELGWGSRALCVRVHAFGASRLPRRILREKSEKNPHSFPLGKLWGIRVHCPFQEWGISLLQGFWHSCGFWLEIQTRMILLEKTSSLSPIGGLDKIVEVFKGVFPRFYGLFHCLSSHNLSYHYLYTVAWLGKINVNTYFAFKTYATICWGWWICPLPSRLPSGICHPKPKKYIRTAGIDWCITRLKSQLVREDQSAIYKHGKRR